MMHINAELSQWFKNVLIKTLLVLVQKAKL